MPIFIAVVWAGESECVNCFVGKRKIGSIVAENIARRYRISDVVMMCHRNIVETISGGTAARIGNNSNEHSIRGLQPSSNRTAIAASCSCVARYFLISTITL